MVRRLVISQHQSGDQQIHDNRGETPRDFEAFVEQLQSGEQEGNDESGYH